MQQLNFLLRNNHAHCAETDIVVSGFAILVALQTVQCKLLPECACGALL
jgi:hypothetical protein